MYLLIICYILIRPLVFSRSGRVPRRWRRLPHNIVPFSPQVQLQIRMQFSLHLNPHFLDSNPTCAVMRPSSISLLSNYLFGFLSLFLSPLYLPFLWWRNQSDSRFTHSP